MGEFIISKEIAEIVCKKSYSIADFCRNLGWKAVGGNYRVVHKYIDKYNLDTSHFTDEKSNIGNKHGNLIPDDKFFVIGGEHNSRDIMRRLLNGGYKEYRCHCCGLNKWNGNDIRLQIHHIDGNHSNNELSNLEFLCPNCHSQTDNFCGRKLIGKNMHVYERKRKYNCACCGKPLLRQPKSGLCIECFRKRQRENRFIKNKNVREYNDNSIVEKDYLVKKFIELKSFLAVANYFSVTDNAIRKWCDKYGIPRKRKELEIFLEKYKNI